MPFKFAEILNDEFKKRNRRNPRYSVRAFARDLGISQSNASLLIRGRSGLSRVKAQTLGEKLGFKGEDLLYFVDLSVSECSKHSETRKEAALRLRQYNSRFNTIGIELARAISSWQTLVTIELFQIYQKKTSVEMISKALQMSDLKVRSILRNLRHLNILKGHKILTDFMALPDGAADAEIYRFHIEMLQKAASVVYDPKVKEKNISTAVIRMRKSDFDWAVKEFRQFRRTLSAKLESGNGHDSVFCISTPFFRLDQEAF